MRIFSHHKGVRGLQLALAVCTLVLAGCSVRIPESGSRGTVLFFAAPAYLTPGARLDADELEARLERLGYTAEPASPSAPRQYHEAGGRVFEIAIPPFRDASGNFGGGLARLSIDDGRVAESMLNGAPDGQLRLEPERIATYEGSTAALSEPITLGEAPPLLVKSLVAVEDRRFYHHFGVDLVGLGRAAWTNTRRHHTVQGGSTLTMQLARSLYLHNRRTFGRKLREVAMALALEARYSKDEILAGYLNATYWGTWGATEIRGARAAADYYLGKSLDEAGPADIALLVGLIRAPNSYSPYASREKALARRNDVLDVLVRQRVITPEEGRDAKLRPLPSRRAPARVADPAYFLDAARAEIARRTSQGTLSRPGLQIYTTLDIRDQEAAVTAVGDGLKRLEHDVPSLRRKGQPLQCAAIVMSPVTGEVSALVGGRNYQESPFNRATDALRQPGSLFKPFVYLTAFRHPARDDGTWWTPMSRIPDEPLEIGSGRHVYRPENYDHEFRGEVSVREALEQSINVPTARVAQEVGIRNIVRSAEALGITSELHPVPSLALGSSEVTLMEITAAYAGLADGGTAHRPTLVRAIYADDGEPVALAPIDAPEGVEPEAAYMVTNLMEGVVDEGTAARARALGLSGVAAGKTGTTDAYRDAWFVGFTPARVAGVWVGFDRTDVTGLSGASAALPTWVGIMQRIEPPGADGAFRRPPGVVTRVIDPETGLIATDVCPTTREEVFLEGTEPTEECAGHGGLFNWFKSIFGR